MTGYLWQIQDFPDRGRKPLSLGRKPIICQIFVENCMKIKEIEPRQECASLAHLGSANDYINQTIDQYPLCVCVFKLDLLSPSVGTMLAILLLRVHSHLATVTQIFDVVSFVSEMVCIVTNVTVHTWWQEEQIVVFKFERTIMSFSWMSYSLAGSSKLLSTPHLLQPQK